MDEVVGSLGALAIGVDGSNNITGLICRGDLGRRGTRLDGLQAIEANVTGLGFAGIDSKSQGNNLSDVSVGTKDTDGDTERLAEKAHSLETLLVVGTTTTNEDLDLVGDQLVLELLEGANDTLEGGSDVGKVGNTTTNDEDLALGVRGAAGDEIDWKN